MQQPNMLEELQSQAEKPSTLCCPPTDDECQNLNGPQILAPDEIVSFLVAAVISQKINTVLGTYTNTSYFGKNYYLQNNELTLSVLHSHHQ